jgi:hypothetical protein
VVDFEHGASGRDATGFFICPDCNIKFIVKIQDVGKANNNKLFTSPSLKLTWHFKSLHC